MANGVTQIFETQEQADKWIKKMKKIPKYPMSETEKREDGKIVASVWD